MSILIRLPDPVAENLRWAARKRRISPETMALQILEAALQTEQVETPEQVVARIKALPAKDDNVRPATLSLQEILESSPEDPEFDLADWQRRWSEIEAEMRSTSRANLVADIERISRKRRKERQERKKKSFLFALLAFFASFA